jgi:hypothetical protein
MAILMEASSLKTLSAKMLVLWQHLKEEAVRDKMAEVDGGTIPYPIKEHTREEFINSL